MLGKLFVLALVVGFFLMIANGISRRMLGVPLLWWRSPEVAPSLILSVGRWALGVALLMLATLVVGDLLGQMWLKDHVGDIATLGILATVVWGVAARMLRGKFNALDDLRGSAGFLKDEDAKKLGAAHGPGARDADVLLGRLSNGQPFSFTTDKHVLVVASARSGKGTDLIIPNLLHHQGPVFVLDPKGENARATARHRNTLGKVHCLDPWGLTGRSSSRFNPLAYYAVPAHAAEVATGAASLAATLVPPNPGENSYFYDGARQLVEALIGFAVTDPSLRAVADLPLVRNLLAYDLRANLEIMGATPHGPDAVRSNAARLLQLGQREFGSIVSTALTQTAFLDDPRLQDALSYAADRQVDFDDWSDTHMSVFVCLPPQHLSAFSNWLRLMITAALDGRMRARRRTSAPVQFYLDELAILGRMPKVEEAIGLASGYGIQVWSIFQDLGQIKDTYKDRASSFIGNSGIRVFFGTQDYETAKMVSDLLGTQTVSVEVVQGGTVVDTVRESRALLYPDEVMRLGTQDMLVWLPHKKPLRLLRGPYYQDDRFRGRWDDPRTQSK